jgi:hypothetical protein
MTNSQIVSKVINSLRLINKDEHISRRYVLRVLRDTAKVLIAQKLMERSIQEDLNLYTHIPCFEFEKVEIVSCPIIEFRKCATLMKSVKPLPELIFSRLGASIKNITNVEGLVQLGLISSQQYLRNRNRKVSIKGEVYVYLGVDNHLYIPDYEIWAIDLDTITMKTDEADECSSCKKVECKSGYEYEFICPDRLLDAVFKDALQTLTTTYKAITPDQNPNNVEKG